MGDERGMKSVRKMDTRVCAWRTTLRAARPKIALARACYGKHEMKTAIVHSGERGSMMMEYIVVTAAIGMALAVFMERNFFDFDTVGGKEAKMEAPYYKFEEQRFDMSLGRQVAAFFERLAGGLALPIP